MRWLDSVAMMADQARRVVVDGHAERSDMADPQGRRTSGAVRERARKRNGLLLDHRTDRPRHAEGLRCDRDLLGRRVPAAFVRCDILRRVPRSRGSLTSRVGIGRPSRSWPRRDVAGPPPSPIHAGSPSPADRYSPDARATPRLPLMCSARPDVGEAVPLLRPRARGLLLDGRRARASGRRTHEARVVPVARAGGRGRHRRRARRDDLAGRMCCFGAAGSRPLRRSAACAESRHRRRGTRAR
jgi:hypothetical protein